MVYRNLADVIRALSKETSEMYCSIIIRRSHFLEDTLLKTSRRTFDAHKNLEVSVLNGVYILFISESHSILYIQVEFIGEDGCDTGGLRREFFSLLARNVTPSFIDDKGVFVHNALALQVGQNVMKLVIFLFVFIVLSLVPCRGIPIIG